MNNIYKLSASALALVAMSGTPVFAQTFNAVGTDYSTAVADKWSEDSINDFVQMANSFSCMINQSAPDKMSNATYETLISEVECKLEDEVINASGVSNKDKLSSSIMKMSRASTTSVQEGQFWFNAQSGFKFAGAMAMSKDAIDVPPYGEWSISYYNNAVTEGHVGDEFTNATTPISGYVDITAATADEGGGVILSSYQTNDMAGIPGTPMGLRDSTTASKIQYYDTAGTATRILGRSHGKDDGNQTFDIVTAGKTNATNFYRRVFPTGVGNAPNAGQCLKRDSTWKTVHRYGVYNKSDGSKLSLTGGFGFDYTEASTPSRGFLSQHGAWFENAATAFNTTALGKTKAITEQNDAATPYTLSWAPGKLSERVAVVESLPTTGISYFKKWTQTGNEAEVRVVSNGATPPVFQATYWLNGTQVADPFNGVADDTVVKKVAAGGANAGIDDHNWIGWMYSPEKRTEIYWNGGTSISFYNETDASSDPTLLGAATGWTALIATQDYAPADPTKFPVVATTWVADATDSWSYGEKASSKDDTFYFTALTPPTGKLARTLYIDPTGNGPSADDKALMFDFSVNERTDEYTTYGATPATATVKVTRGGVLGIQWPYKSLELRNAGSTKEYKWRTGAYGWDQSVIALKADGSVYSMDKPMLLEYDHAASKDVNEGEEITFVKDPNNMHNPIPALCGTPAGGARNDSNGVAVTECVVEPSDFGTKKYFLRYNGKWVDGLPDMEARNNENDPNGFRVAMVNPKAGTEVKHTDDLGVVTQYVLKPLAIAEMFLVDPVAANCNDIDFSTVAEFGWDMNDMPASTLVSLPSQTWAQLPAKADLKCTVKQGVVPAACGTD